MYHFAHIAAYYAHRWQAYRSASRVFQYPSLLDWKFILSAQSPYKPTKLLRF